MSQTPPEMHEQWILRTELLWAFGVGVFVAAALSTILITALTMGINPPSNVERVDPKALHLSGEFAEQNLGASVAADVPPQERSYRRILARRHAELERLRAGDSAGTP